MSPVWLDPAVALPQFRKAMSQFPSRLPMAEVNPLEAARVVVPRLGETRRQALHRLNLDKGLAIRRAKALADAEAHGETLEERKKRKKKESTARRDAYLKRLARR